MFLFLKIIDFTYFQLIGYNVHLGVRKKDIHPSISSVLKGVLNNFSFFNLCTSTYNLKAGLHVLKEIISKKGIVLFVNVNKMTFIKIPTKLRLYYIKYKFTLEKVPGILTNFLKLYRIKRKKKKVRKGHILKKIPNFVLSNSEYDYHVPHEANILKIPNIYVSDSNINIDMLSYYRIYGNSTSSYTTYFYYFIIFKIIKQSSQISFLLFKQAEKNKINNYCKSIITNFSNSKKKKYFIQLLRKF